MANKLGMTIYKEIPIDYTDVEVAVRTNGKLLGRLKISRGSVDWLPSRRSTSAYRLRWSKFAELMEEHGRT
jgi:hypothetical protein